MGIAATAPAAMIGFVGAAEGSEVDDWRTSGTGKLYDIDGNGIYGTMGAASWGDAYPGMQEAGSTDLGWAPIGNVQQQTDPFNRSIDNALTAPDNHAAGIAFEGLTFQLTGVISDYAGKAVRVGVMTDLLASENRAADRGKGLQLLQTVGGDGDSGAMQLREGRSGDGFPDMFFWDITGAMPGDQFRLLALQDFGQGSFYPGYLGPVTFDLVPEPNAALLALGGALVLHSRRRRAR